MKFEKSINEELEIAVPEVVRANVLRRSYGGITGVKVENERGRNSWADVNTIQVQTRGRKSASAATEESSVDDVARAITLVMHNHWLELQEHEDYKPSYRVTISQRDASNSSGYARNAFYYKYVPGEVDEAAARMDEMETQWAMQAHESLRSQIDSLTVQNQQLHDTVVKLAELSSAPVNAAVDMFNQGVGIFTSGANMLVDAHRTQFSTESVRIEQEAKNKRTERVMGVVEKPLSHLVAQFSGWAVKKWLSGSEDGSGSVGDHDVVDTTAHEAQPADVTQAAVDATAAAAQRHEEEPAHPLAMMFEAFGSTITPKQRKEMNENLTKAQVHLLDELFCAPTDEGALAAWDDAVATMPPEKWVWLAGQLNEDQSENLNKARMIVSKIKAAQAEAKKKAKAERKENDE